MEKKHKEEKEKFIADHKSELRDLQQHCRHLEDELRHSKSRGKPDSSTGPPIPTRPKKEEEAAAVVTEELESSKTEGKRTFYSLRDKAKNALPLSALASHQPELQSKFGRIRNKIEESSLQPTKNSLTILFRKWKILVNGVVIDFVWVANCNPHKINHNSIHHVMLYGFYEGIYHWFYFNQQFITWLIFKLP